MAYLPYSGGGSSAYSTINDASGENDGPGLKTIGVVAAAAYVVYRTVM